VQYRTLKLDRILLTQRRLNERIQKRFPNAGLNAVAKELLAIAEDAGAAADAIRRPNVPLRAAVGVLIAAGLAVALWALFSPRIIDPETQSKSLFELTELALRATVFLGAVVVFLLTLEARWKRRKALRELHDLRAVAHVIDMHQVSKDPERLVARAAAGDPNDDQTTRTPFELGRYLTYCIELLAMISKIAALYVQDFPDAPTVSAVDQVENLCAGLSQKIFQKVMLLDQLADESAAGTVVGPTSLIVPPT